METVRNELVLLVEEIQPADTAIEWEQVKRIAAVVNGHPSTALPVLRPLYEMHRTHQATHGRVDCARCDRIAWLLRELEGTIAASLPSASWDDDDDTSPQSTGGGRHASSFNR